MLAKIQFKFKPYHGGRRVSQDASPETLNPQQRRREQIRRAQKTHRERKEAYTKSLENEVVQLRAREAKILLEVKTLYSKISILERQLVESGIPLPTDQISLDSMSTSESSTPNYNLYIEDVNPRKGQKRINVQGRAAEKPHRQVQQANSGRTLLPSPHIPQSRRQQSGVGGKRRPDAFPVHNISSSSPPIPPISAHTPSCLGDIDQSVVGIDFVLNLESPCLGHIDVEHSHNSPPTGHALTVSATLLHHRPAESDRHLDSQRDWQVSQLGIERLLELSKSIPLDGEVTPVQAWDYIRRNPQYNGLEIGRYEALKEKLLKHVKCYGFGAVVEQAVFENMVFEAFVVGRVF